MGNRQHEKLRNIVGVDVMHRLQSKVRYREFAAAVTLRGYAEAMSAWFGKEPKLVFLPWPEWKARQTNEVDATETWEHIARSPNCSIAKAERLLSYAPAYSSLRAVQESVSWLVEAGEISVRPLP
jgi:nucleoside-diphosphate-sugar epimerase